MRAHLILQMHLSIYARPICARSHLSSETHWDMSFQRRGRAHLLTATMLKILYGPYSAHQYQCEYCTNVSILQKAEKYAPTNENRGDVSMYGCVQEKPSHDVRRIWGLWSVSMVTITMTNQSICLCEVSSFFFFGLVRSIYHLHHRVKVEWKFWQTTEPDCLWILAGKSSKKTKTTTAIWC